MDKLDFPKEIMVEATNFCNCRCFFCGSLNSKRERGYIDPVLAEDIIKKAYDYGARKISFHCMGEPFLCKDLAKYVSIAKMKGYTYIYLDTNGVFATPDRVFPVLDAGLDSLKFSIHAATPETHKQITGIDGFEKIVDNLENVHAYIEKKKLSCKLIAYQAISKINQHEVEGFYNLMNPLVDEVWTRPIHNGSGVRLENSKYSIGEKEYAMKESPCRELYCRMIIDWQGKSIACSTDWTGTLVYGDAKEDDLLNLWNNETIWLIRKQHERKETLPNICAKCMMAM